MKKEKKSIFKKWWFWLIVVIIIGGAIGAGSDKPKKVDSSSQPKQEQKQSKEEDKTETFKIGDTIKVKDFEIKVNKIKVSKGDEISKPKKGNEYLCVDITVKNISDEEQTVSSIAMFKVVDKDGRAFDQAITTDQKGQLDGTVGKGRKITGEYVVEVPKGAKGLELEFDSSLISSGQVVVKLN